MTETVQRYHHGDLRASLIQAGTERLEKQGIEGLTLRKLANDIGVSRTAPYHHFKDKSALLSAIAAQGFVRWHEVAQQIFEQEDRPIDERLRVFIHRYIGFAADNPQLYELMFGRTLWQPGAASDDLKQVAYPSFQYQVSMTRLWQQHGLLPEHQDPLRLAQVTWGTLHGIARLLIDGIYADSSHIDAMCDCAADLFMQNIEPPK